MIDKRLYLATKAVSAINRSHYADSVEKAREPWYKKVRGDARAMVADDVKAIKAAVGDGGDIKAARKATDERKGAWKAFISSTYKAVGSDFANAFYKKAKRKSIMYSKADSEFGYDAEWFAANPDEVDTEEDWMQWGDDYVDGVSDDKAGLIMDNRYAQAERGYARQGDDENSDNSDLKDLWEWLLISAAMGADYFAVTEVSAASNFGRRLSAERMAFDGGTEFEHEWVTVGDDRVRQSHRDMDGETLPLDESFRIPGNFGSDEMMFPGDSSLGAGPENIVNCRCTEQITPAKR